MKPTIFGIRHHGPGSARSLLSALEALQPDCLLIEGPPDADPLIALAADAAMEPPVALLVYEKKAPANAVFYPFAEFSPEWQAMRYAVRRALPVRFMDLPMAHQLATGSEETAAENGSEDPERIDEFDEGYVVEGPVSETGPDHSDPLDWFARQAGYEDGESWWNTAIEERTDATALFEAIAEAMTLLREAFPTDDPRELRREAWMRKTLRAAVKEGHEKIAVVCGAWHVPALSADVKIKDDQALLRALPKTPVDATWVPWTYGRLARASGYGAGITSPGWYHHLWQVRQDTTTSLTIRWMTNVAILLRKADMDASSAHVIESVRLAESLAGLRNRPTPGLEELNDAAQSIFFTGDASAMRLIDKALLIAERLGAVSPDVPKVPLQLDIEKQQRSLRLKPHEATSQLDLDLRTPAGLGKSQLLHRLRLLGISWGTLEEVDRRKKGTFHEFWSIRWEPEFSVRIIEAAIWGSTVQSAATAFAQSRAREATAVADLALLAEAVMLAELPAAVATAVEMLQTLSAQTNDIADLMAALPTLVVVLRYGNVRQSDAGMIEHAAYGFITRICIGLASACYALDDDAAENMVAQIASTHQSVMTIDEAVHKAHWTDALGSILQSGTIHAHVRGKSCRLLLDCGSIDAETAAAQMQLALSVGNDPQDASAWIEGFLAHSGMLLVYNQTLLEVVSGWVSALGTEQFTHQLPLIRRTFSTFSEPEREALAVRIKSMQAGDVSTAQSSADAEQYHAPWGDAAVETLMRLTGWRSP